MKLRVSCTYVAVFVAVFSAFPVLASDWAVVPAISTTLGINSGRLCVGDGSRRDIGCPTLAPGVTTAGDVSITGNLSASKFIGDGSGPTWLCSTGGHITSSSLSVTVNEATSGMKARPDALEIKIGHRAPLVMRALKAKGEPVRRGNWNYLVEAFLFAAFFAERAK